MAATLNESDGAILGLRPARKASIIVGILDSVKGAVTVLLGLLLVCTLACTARDNHLLSRSSPRSEVHAPHEYALVRSQGRLIRVGLHDASREEIGAIPLAMSDDASVRIYVRDKFYVIESGEEVRTVHGIVAGRAFESGRDPVMSPDEKMFSLVPALDPLAEEQIREIVVVTISDGSTRRYPVGRQDIYSLTWAEDGQGILFRHLREGGRRLDLGTGEVTEDLETRPRLEETSTCAHKGFALEERSRGEKAMIVLTPLAGEMNPERLAFLEPRTLVTATSHDYSAKTTKNSPDYMDSLGFTRSCTHHLFRLGSRIFVGDLESGKFSFLTLGEFLRILP